MIVLNLLFGVVAMLAGVAGSVLCLRGIHLFMKEKFYSMGFFMWGGLVVFILIFYWGITLL